MEYSAGHSRFKRGRFFGRALLSAALFALLAGLFALPPAVRAEEEEVRVSVTADAESLSESAVVLLTFEVFNGTGDELQSVTVSRNGVPFLVEGTEGETVPAGGTARLPLHYEMPEEEIGSDVRFTVSYLRNGETEEQEAAVRIPRTKEPETPPVRPVPKEGEEVRITVGTDTEALSESAEVLLIFEISNYTEFELHNLTVSQDGVAFPVEGAEDCVIPAGGSARLPLRYQVPDSKIGLDISFTVSYLQYGEPVEQKVSLCIPRAEEPVISLSRTVDREEAEEGESVVITYTLKNETRYDMTDITLTDGEIADRPVLEHYALNAGGTLSQTYTFVMEERNVTSAPSVTYEVNGKEKVFSALDPVILHMVRTELELTVERGVQSIAGVPFTVTVSNVGNRPVTGIRLLDETGNALTGETFSLESGEAYTVSVEVQPGKGQISRTFSVSVTGKTAGGETYELRGSGSFEILPYVDDNQIDVALTAETVRDWSAQTGDVEIKLRITNYSEVTLKDAVLSETVLGPVRTFPELGNGVTEFTCTLAIGSPRNLTFTLTGTDPAGNARALGSAALTVAYPEVAPETEKKEPAVTEDGEEMLSGKLNVWGSRLMRLLTGLGVAALVALIAALILLAVEVGMTGATDDAEDEEEEDFFFPELPPENDTDFGKEIPINGEPPTVMERTRLRYARSFGEGRNMYRPADRGEETEPEAQTFAAAPDEPKDHAAREGKPPVRQDGAVPVSDEIKRKAEAQRPSESAGTGPRLTEESRPSALAGSHPAAETGDRESAAPAEEQKAPVRTPAAEQKVPASVRTPAAERNGAPRRIETERRSAVQPLRKDRVRRLS